MCIGQFPFHLDYHNLIGSVNLKSAKERLADAEGSRYLLHKNRLPGLRSTAKDNAVANISYSVNQWLFGRELDIQQVYKAIYLEWIIAYFFLYLNFSFFVRCHNGKKEPGPLVMVDRFEDRERDPEELTSEPGVFEYIKAISCRDCLACSLLSVASKDILKPHTNPLRNL